MEMPYWCLTEEHQYGGRMSKKTSGLYLCFEGDYFLLARKCTFTKRSLLILEVFKLLQIVRRWYFCLLVCFVVVVVVVVVFLFFFSNNKALSRRILFSRTAETSKIQNPPF